MFQHKMILRDFFSEMTQGRTIVKEQLILCSFSVPNTAHFVTLPANSLPLQVAEDLLNPRKGRGKETFRSLDGISLSAVPIDTAVNHSLSTSPGNLPHGWQ